MLLFLNAITSPHLISPWGGVLGWWFDGMCGPKFGNGPLERLKIRKNHTLWETLLQNSPPYKQFSLPKMPLYDLKKGFSKQKSYKLMIICSKKSKKLTLMITFLHFMKKVTLRETSIFEKRYPYGPHIPVPTFGVVPPPPGGYLSVKKVLSF